MGRDCLHQFRKFLKYTIMATFFFILGLCCLVGGIILFVDQGSVGLIVLVAGIIVIVFSLRGMDKAKAEALENAEVCQSVVKRIDWQSDKAYILLENGEILSESCKDFRFLLRKGDVITYKKAKEYTDIIKIDYGDNDEEQDQEQTEEISETKGGNYPMFPVVVTQSGEVMANPVPSTPITLP